MANLLIIDDDPSLLEVLTLAFEDAGRTRSADRVAFIVA